jgi:hypothetical protein
MLKSNVGSSRAFYVWIGTLVGTFIFTTFKPSGAYDAFVVALTGGFTAYLGKRLWQKKGQFGGQIGGHIEDIDKPAD